MEKKECFSCGKLQPINLFHKSGYVRLKEDQEPIARKAKCWNCQKARKRELAMIRTLKYRQSKQVIGA